jgi:predicted phosphodiesterase
MKTRYIGDVHGKRYELETILHNTPKEVEKVIQVGDLGVGFGQGDYWHESLDSTLQKYSARFIRGNHDNPNTCKTLYSWIQDGHTENGTMFIGGAWSIDSAWRTEGYNFWRDEELSITELLKLLDLYKNVKPRVMVTHDCPISISKQLFIDKGLTFSTKQHTTKTGQALEAMFKAHKPEIWIFGHWHIDADEVIESTRFICLSELKYIDI